MDKAYEDDETLALTKDHGFFTVVAPKKILSYLGAMINIFINSTTILNDIS